MKIRFFSLASGSSGNCYYIGCDSYGILVDAGIGVRTIKKRLRDFGIPMESIWAVFVTHDHADHIKSVGVLGEQLFIPVYATSLVHKGIQKNYSVTIKMSSSVRIIEKNKPIQFHDFSVAAFNVPHDSTDNVGYCISVGGKTIVIATDIGTLTPEIDRFARMADFLVVEANYDKEMLKSSPYPAHLKTRIVSGAGHLGNDQVSEFLSSVYSPRLKHIMLCHLSKVNNNPDLAYKTVETALANIGVRVGVDVVLATLKRNGPSELYVLD